MSLFDYFDIIEVYTWTGGTKTCLGTWMVVVKSITKEDENPFLIKQKNKQWEIILNRQLVIFLESGNFIQETGIQIVDKLAKRFCILEIVCTRA